MNHVAYPVSEWDWHPVFCCVKCDRPIPFHERNYNDGVCPHCGHQAGIMSCEGKFIKHGVCQTYRVVRRRIPRTVVAFIRGEPIQYEVLREPTIR